MVNPLITLTTDFGTADGYVGAVKGSILSINPRARLVDLSNEIPSYDIVVGAYHLGCAFSFYPKGTIHLAVVDPGVGSRRHPILVKTKNHFFVGPDNGLFTLVTLRDPVVGVFELTKTRYFLSEVSSTFHGRDLFGPVAAHLSRGVPPSAFGRRLPSIQTRPEFSVLRTPKGWEGEILFFDKFGNAFTNLHRGEIPLSTPNPPSVRPRLDHSLRKETFLRSLSVYWRGRRLPLYRTYSDIPPRMPGALFGSSGFLEIALREDSFGDRFRARRGDAVRLLAASLRS
ncbi:MAG TPA: SAM-dependent chlorinase/fluorinase [bacterium]|nr:SAM-dependent chlorinase/fluorinase [bacterium]